MSLSVTFQYPVGDSYCLSSSDREGKRWHRQLRTKWVGKGGAHLESQRKMSSTDLLFSGGFTVYVYGVLACFFINSVVKPHHD